MIVSESARRKLHRQFLIATKRPVFRKANVHRFTDDQVCNDSCLTDVHLGLNLPTGAMSCCSVQFHILSVFFDVSAFVIGFDVTAVYLGLFTLPWHGSGVWQAVCLCARGIVLCCVVYDSCAQ